MANNPRDFSRRSFLKVALVGTGALAVSPRAAALAQGRTTVRTPESGSDLLRLTIAEAAELVRTRKSRPSISPTRVSLGSRNSIRR